LNVVERRILALPIKIGWMWLKGDQIPVVGNLAREASVLAEVRPNVIEHITKVESPEHISNDWSLA